MDLLLRFTEPGTDRRRLRRLAGRVSVGRAVPDGHLWLDAPTVAPLHAEIDATGAGGPVVRLLAPGGALFVNGAFVAEAPLAPGDEVAFGDVAVTVLDAASLVPAAPAVSAAAADGDGSPGRGLAAVAAAVVLLAAAGALLSPPGRRFLESTFLRSHSAIDREQAARARGLKTLLSVPASPAGASVAVPPRATPAPPHAAPTPDVPRMLADVLDGTVALIAIRSIGGGMLGSGFVLPAKEPGLIMTNRHVVDGSDWVLVRMRDRVEFRARVWQRDGRTDLAVLRIEPDASWYRFKPIPVAARSNTIIGMNVYAAGTPLSDALDFTVTRGIVSADKRLLDNVPYIQHDAAINPGNSGGPLVNDAGQVIGVNTMKIRGAQGLGFAIPSEEIADFLRRYEIK